MDLSLRRAPEARGNCTGRLTLLLAALLVAGCDPADDAETSSPIERPPIRVVVLDDEPLGRAVQREWESRGEGRVEITAATSEQWLADPTSADVFIFPSELTGRMMKDRRLDRLKSGDMAADYAPRDIHNQVRAGPCSWDNAVVAASFGTPHRLLVYRADILDELNLTPPETWSELRRTCEQLRERREAWDPDSKRSALLEPLGSDESPGAWAADALLCRAAGYAVDVSLDSMLWNTQDATTRVAARRSCRLSRTSPIAAPTPRRSDFRHNRLGWRCWMIRPLWR